MAHARALNEAAAARHRTGQLDKWKEHRAMHTAAFDLASRFVSVAGAKTRFYEAGAGPAVVLWHGDEFGGAASASTWLPNLPGLAEQFHVLAPDRLGQGFTDNPPTDGDYTAEAVVAHMYEFAQTLGLERIHLVGQS